MSAAVFLVFDRLQERSQCDVHSNHTPKIEMALTFLHRWVLFNKLILAIRDRGNVELQILLH